MKLYKRRKTSEFKRQLYLAHKYLSSVDEKMAELEKKKRGVLENIQSIKRQLDDAMELEAKEKEVFVSNKVPLVEELAGRVETPLKAVQIVGKTISFVYDVGGKEAFYNYDDIDEGTKAEISRLRRLLRETGKPEAVIV